MLDILPRIRENDCVFSILEATMGRADTRHSVKMKKLAARKKKKARQRRDRKGERTHKKVTLKD